MYIILFIVVLLLLFGGLPQVSGQWHNLGYGPSGVGVLVVVILLVVLLRGA